MRCRLILSLILLVLFSSLVCSAQENISLTGEALETSNALDLAEQNIEDITSSGMNIIRYNDTLTLAKQLFEAQLALGKTGGKTDFFLVNQKIGELNNLKSEAFLALDELKALEFALEEEGSNQTEVIDLYNQVKEAFESERYEEARTLIDDTYEKISELEAFDTQLRAFYEATSGSLQNFLKKRWKVIIITIIILIIVTIPAYKSIMVFWIRTKINNLEERKNTIHGLIAKTQKEYFEKGNLSETTYKTRIKKYGELIRDINRQIPLLKEEMEMVLKKQDKK